MTFWACHNRKAHLLVPDTEKIRGDVLTTMPAWREVPQPVLINCVQVKEMPDREEYIVQFECQRGNFTSFVRKGEVNPEAKQLHAFIIADVQDKGVLLALPQETLTSGPRLLVFEDEKDQLLEFKDWRQNGSQ